MARRSVSPAPLARERGLSDHDFDARVVVRFLTGEGGSAADQLAARRSFMALGDGLQSVLVGGEHWRVFVKTNAKGVRVAVAQQTRVRDAAAQERCAR
ncbi:hypothetical protein LP420_38855 [Massilia sp. B-10]|nr:hypothetical protein LP420_38855 [Massilia sp. B-10]